ncbi:RING finger domain-containing protein [Colletotrichum higginsianum]|nr:RING finger domain-containing protein [Colletotrichum higginsianum]
MQWRELHYWYREERWDVRCSLRTQEPLKQGLGVGGGRGTNVGLGCRRIQQGAASDQFPACIKPVILVLIRACSPAFLSTVLRNSSHGFSFVPGILGIARSDSSCMDSSKPGLDLERELTCSICTELLYQPLTLLDCLHTYCGACLKDWFSFQANQAENSPTPPVPGANVFTCPSCRAPVRDTRHNATVATLLDMLVAANPDRRRSETDVEEMGKKYRPGDTVLPELRLPERTRRRDEPTTRRGGCWKTCEI